MTPERFQALADEALGHALDELVFASDTSMGEFVNICDHRGEFIVQYHLSARETAAGTMAALCEGVRAEFKTRLVKVLAAAETKQPGLFD